MIRDLLYGDEKVDEALVVLFHIRDEGWVRDREQVQEVEGE